MNYKRINELETLMQTIAYGWVDKDGGKHTGDDMFVNQYVLQSPQDLMQSKLGVCWDQVELERSFFENNKMLYETYFIVYYDEQCPTHTFLIYPDNGKWYWFENSWEIYKGIHEYETKELLLEDVKTKFIRTIESGIVNDNLEIYQYTKPQYGIDVTKFYKHCESGNRI